MKSRRPNCESVRSIAEGLAALRGHQVTVLTSWYGRPFAARQVTVGRRGSNLSEAIRDVSRDDFLIPDCVKFCMKRLCAILRHGTIYVIFTIYSGR